MTLQNFKLNGLILIRDNKTCSGEMLAFAILQQAKNMLILTIPGREVALRKRYSTICERMSAFNSRATFSYIDSKTMLDVMNIASTSKPLAYFLDCVDVLVDQYGVDFVASFIYQLKGFSPTVTICPELSVDKEEYSRFCAVADAILYLYIQDGQCIIESTIFQGSRKPINMVWFDDFWISSKKFELPLSSVESSLSHENFNRSFDEQLKLNEKLSGKSQRHLPYTSITKQANLINHRMANCKVRVGGQVIYTPDKEDDFDESDPDDDLNL